MQIGELSVGQTARVTGYRQADRAYRHKLLRMGLTKGVHLRLVRRAPMGDPVELELRGFHLTLRKAEAEALEVEPL